MAESETKLEFEKLFKTSFFGLYVTGAHPNIPKDWKWMIKFTIAHVIFTIQIILIVYSTLVYDVRNDVIAASGNVSLMVAYIVTSMTYGILLKYQDSFIFLINTMKTHYVEAHSLPQQEKEAIKRYAAKGKTICQFWFFITVNSFLGFVCLPLATMTYTSMVGNFKYNPVFQLSYPSLFYELDEPVLFWINFALGTYFAIYSINMYMCVMPMGPVSMLHACGRLDILKIKVNELFTDKNMTHAERAERIKFIAVQLQDVFDFIDHIQKCFKVLYEVLLKGSTVVQPFLAYQVTSTINTPEFKMEFFIILCGCVFLSGSSCYYGEKIMEKGEEFRESLYTCGWEKVWDKSARKSLLLMMIRMEKRTAIQSIFRTICLTTLTDVFHSSYAIFSLLNAAWN